MGQTRQDIEKRFSASSKGVENEAFPVNIWHLKFSFLSFAKFDVSSVSMMSGLGVINVTQ